MTMQIGMVGTDGVLIASDTCWVSSKHKMRNREDASKIIIDPSKGMAVSMARCMVTAKALAERILADNDWKSNIQEIGRKVLEGAEKGREDVHCLVVCANPTPQLYSFRLALIAGAWGPVCKQMQSSIIAGDEQNSAVFWQQRYSKEITDGVPLTALVPIATHLVLAARQINSVMIGGLEVVICDASGVRRLSKESIFNLRMEYSKREDYLRESFFSSPQQLTYNDG